MRKPALARVLPLAAAFPASGAAATRRRAADLTAARSDATAIPPDGLLFLSTLPATDGQRRLALFVVVVSAAIFLAVAPFAKIKLTPVWAFIPIYESALVVNDLITAVLLFGQYNFTKSRSLLMLASGYLFTALMTVAHALTFPGLFSPTGLLGAGPQSTAWLYMLWHGGFPVAVIAYAVIRDENRSAASPRTGARRAVLRSIAVVIALVVAFTVAATTWHATLPEIMHDNHYTPTMNGVVSGVWASSLVALAILWRRRPRTMLDLWLLVVMSSWLFDIALSAVLNGGRFDLGFYAGRIYGLAAASLVLFVLLTENGALYSRIVEAHESERRGREHLQQKTAELVAVNKELETFSYSVSHDLRAPLRAIDGFALMLEEDYVERLDGEGRRLLSVIRDNSRKMGTLIDDLLALSRLGRQAMARAEVAMERLVHDVCQEVMAVDDYARARVDVGSLPDISGDRALLRQVWMNLLANALKYSSRVPQPHIEVGADRQGTEIVYWVRDNGAGFDMQYIHKLFGVFQRLHRSEDFAGTGVGLAIVARIVSRHGGRVWAQGKVDEGATFHFSLPAEDTHE